MKKLLLSLLAFTFLLGGCLNNSASTSSNPENSIEYQNLKKLLGNWTISYSINNDSYQEYYTFDTILTGISGGTSEFGLFGSLDRLVKNSETFLENGTTVSGGYTSSTDRFFITYSYLNTYDLHGHDSTLTRKDYTISHSFKIDTSNSILLGSSAISPAITPVSTISISGLKTNSNSSISK